MMPGAEGFEFHDLQPAAASFLDDVWRGLSHPQKELPAKYFYDARGSELFEAICGLPEYYPTRTEIAIMRRHAAEMADRLGPDALLIEYGSGTSQKTRILLEKLRPAAYLPIDISPTPLLESARQLVAALPGLRVIAVCADYGRPLVLPDCTATGYRRKVVYFPGSTIGNLTRQETLDFLAQVRDLVEPGGAMLVGVDLKKDPQVLHAAYNDARGVTAAFNLNLLARINRELRADFDLAAFQHYAYYSPRLGRIEMHLVSARSQVAHVYGRHFDFREGESIHTEISCKYGVAEFQEMARGCGFAADAVWTDEDRLFAVHYLTVA